MKSEAFMLTHKPKRHYGLIKMDYGAFGYTEGYYRFKQGLPFIKINRYKAKWRQDAFTTGLKMGWQDAKAGKHSAVYIYNPK